MRQSNLVFIISFDFSFPAASGPTDYSKLHRFWEIKFMSKTEEVNQEYLIYDITGFVGSVGGTLGLFIGFSFRDIVEIILDLGQNLF